MTDKQGSIHYLALGWSKGWGMLADHPKKRLKDLYSKVSADFDSASASEADKLAKISGCLDRLNAFLLQVYRISQHAERLRRPDTMIAMLPPQTEIQGDPNALQALASMPRTAGTMEGANMEDCCADFESLIFHGSAALDRLSKYLINAAHFRKLKTRLDSGKSKYDHRGQRRQLLRESPSLSEVFLVRTGGAIYRDRLTHEQSLMEGINHSFTIHNLEPRKAIVFDCEAFGLPVLTTAWKLSKDLPFFILNLLSLEFAGWDKIDRSDFSPEWSNPAIDFREYLAEDDEGSLRFSLYRSQPKGFKIQEVSLRPEVLERAITP
ncbi:MAG: hypothetical protein IH900_08580 [Proteobacteria bacterium]|nr:hypothetical protein [Pseudomonadota bacterium]